MCHSSADIISKFTRTIDIGEASITARDIMTRRVLVLEFLSHGEGVCVGSDIADERHYRFPRRYYKDMLEAISGNKAISIQGVEGPSSSFTSVSWRAA